MAYVSHVAGTSRYFDHVYDPIFEASCQRDVWKANAKALNMSAPIQITSNYQTMFSDMPNRPGYICWKRQNPLPHFTHPGAITTKSAFMQGIEQRKQICVSGACRCNFFHHPADCVKSLSLKLSLPPECKCIDSARNKTENVGCQTIYRESSVQTRPYLPDYYVREGEPETPEIVRIANILAGSHQPGEFETKIIERSRKRRLWEKELSPTGCLKEFEQRQTILEAFEWEEFIAREEDIQEMQEIRMQLVVELMGKREETMREASAAKLKNASFRIEDERKEKLRKLHHKFSRQIRKLELARKKISRKYKVESIVDEHTDQASDLYAPQMRFGIHPKRLHFVPFKSSFQARLEGFETKKIDPQKLECMVRKYDTLAAPKPPLAEIEKGFNNDKHLTKLYETLKALRASSTVSRNHPNCLRKIHKEKVLAAETPIGPSEDLYESSETHCCVYIQKIIKGRAIQKILYNGRDRCRGLIQEIQTTHMLSAVSAMYPGMSNETIRGRLTIQSQQKRFTQKIQQDNQNHDIYREAEAGILGVLLDFLEKELRRMYEQRKIHALCILAERERMKREAVEAGRRQTENRRRQETDEIYRHMVKASQDTVNMYLENLLIEETDKVAEEVARKKVQAMARRIDQMVSKSMDDKCLSLEVNDNDDVVNDLVKNFMFPEVQKRIARKKSGERTHRHLIAAHEALYGHVENICYIPTPRSSKSVIASGILRGLVDNVLSAESVLSKLGRHENVAKHEAETAIKKILKKVFPHRKWKTSAERIVSATVSGLINNTMQEKQITAASSSLQDTWLQEIINEIKERLWNYTLEADTKQENEDGKTFSPQDLFNFIETKLQPVIAEYETSEMESEIITEGISNEPNQLQFSDANENDETFGSLPNRSLSTNGSSAKKASDFVFRESSLVKESVQDTAENVSTQPSNAVTEINSANDTSILRQTNDAVESLSEEVQIKKEHTVESSLVEENVQNIDETSLPKETSDVLKESILEEVQTNDEHVVQVEESDVHSGSHPN